ncbi:putative kynurenine formamidase-like [Capsicum annuum]|nr:putative kynurenine formamidase-like [Capsicum annuum]KAF3623397.1 putative kynurenine formamidase-like [Capsicum annuum]
MLVVIVMMVGIVLTVMIVAVDNGGGGCDVTLLDGLELELGWKVGSGFGAGSWVVVGSLVEVLIEIESRVLGRGRFPSQDRESVLEVGSWVSDLVLIGSWVSGGFGNSVGVGSRCRWKPATSHAQSGCPYVTSPPVSYPYAAAPSHAASHPPPSAYPAPSPYSTVSPPPSADHPAPSPYPTVPSPSAAYHPASPYPPQSAAYPSPSSSPSAYPPQPYPPQGYSYPPGPCLGAYPRDHIDAVLHPVFI